MPQVNDVLKGEMSAEHTVGKSSSRATLDVEGNWMRTSTCMAVGSSLLVGAQGDFVVGAPKVCFSVLIWCGMSSVAGGFPTQMYSWHGGGVVFFIAQSNYPSRNITGHTW